MSTQTSEVRHLSKEDIKRSRKEHVQSTLAKVPSNQNTSHIGRKVLDADFFCLPIFRNDLPEPPVGPYFRPFQPIYSSTDFANYSVSSLEKNYTWKPHFDIDAGLKVDLVDQEAILTESTDGHKRPLDPIDHRIIHNQNITSKALAFDQNNKPWWLRNTTYLENNLYKSRVVKQTPSKKSEIDATILFEPFSTDFIKNSFQAVKRTFSQSQQQNKQIEWSFPLLPSDQNDSSLTSFVRFDEKYSAFVSDAYSDVDEIHHKRFKRGILTNVRELPTEHGSQGNFAVGLLIPPVGSNESDEPLLYEWARDFKMEIRETNLSTAFAVAIDEEARKCTYSRLHSRVEMHRLNLEHAQPHDATVTRRDYDSSIDKPLVKAE
jgi:hypothetical protein